MPQRIHLTGEPRADHLTNRCIELEEGLRSLRFTGWRDQIELCIKYDGEHALSTHGEKNGFEFDLILEKKPTSNQFYFRLFSKNLIFLKQARLDTDSGINPACHMSIEAVVGSYAVYHATNRHNHKHKDGTESNYMAGKFCHIYRPQVIDATGRFAWCDLDIIDESLTITVPKEFLDEAIYPVRIDPIIGYDDIGIFEMYFGWAYPYNIINSWALAQLVSSTFDVTSISAYTWTYNNPGWPEDADSFKLGIYTKGTNPDGDDSFYVASTGPFEYPTYNAPQWHTKPIYAVLNSGTTYQVAWQAFCENAGFLQARIRLAYDAGLHVADTKYTIHDNWTWPGNLNFHPGYGGNVGSRYLSLYITYADPLIVDMNPITILISPQTIIESRGYGLVDEGNLFAPVNASVRLNTNYSMLHSGTHEPKYALDNDLNTYWRPSSTLNHSLYLKFDDAQLVDAFAFWIHNYNDGFGGDKKWQLAYSTDGFEYLTFGNKPFTDSRNPGVPLVAFKFEMPVVAKYWILSLVGVGDPIEGPDDIPVGPVIEIGGVWFLRDYSLPYDNQYPEPVRFEWGNDIALARSGSGYQEQRFRGYVKTSDKEYVFVQQVHSDLLLNAFKASKGGLLPIAFKPDYDSVDWILCRFTSEHSLQETWSEVFQPKMEVREIGFKRIPYMTKTLPVLSTTAGHWKFGESLADSSANGQTLSIVDVPGGAVYDYGICDHNKTCIVLENEGLLQVAAVDADALDMGISNFALELIFATAPVSETTYLLRKIGDMPSPAPSPEPSPSPVSAGYSVSLTTEGKIDVCLGDGLTEVQGSGYAENLDDRSFHYLAVTVDRTLDLLKVYVDGVQVGSSLDISSITGNITNIVEPFQIGGENLLSDPKCLIGLLDEVCISKQLLSAASIASRHAGFSHDGSWRL